MSSIYNLNRQIQTSHIHVVLHNYHLSIPVTGKVGSVMSHKSWRENWCMENFHIQPCRSVATVVTHSKDTLDNKVLGSGGGVRLCFFFSDKAGEWSVFANIRSGQSYLDSTSTWWRRIAHLKRRTAIRSIRKALLLSHTLLSVLDFSFVLH